MESFFENSFLKTIFAQQKTIQEKKSSRESLPFD